MSGLDSLAKMLTASATPTAAAAPFSMATPVAALNAGVQPTSTPRPDPYDAAVQQAQAQYPWLARMPVPIKLTSGQGPYMSESYGPKDDDNPAPGNFTVELRNQQIKANPNQWAPLLAREGIDYMARHDGVYQQAASDFRQSMTPEQLQFSRQRYERAKAQGEDRSFEDFLKGADLQEFIGGYVLDMPGWKNMQYTPEQKQMLDDLKQYMWQGRQPTSVNIQ